MAVARKHEIKSFVDAENLLEIYPHLRLNLCSASHVVRHLTLMILSWFDPPEKNLSDNKVRTVRKCLLVLHLWISWEEGEGEKLWLVSFFCADKMRKCQNMEMVSSCFEKYKGLVVLFIPTYIA